MVRITSFAVAAALLIATSAHAEQLCFAEAGALYNINPTILQAIAKVESNYQTRAVNWNRNGTYDFGVMQINSNWAATLGMEHWNTLGDACSNIKTGAMILAACMKKYGYTWEAIGCYNSQTPDKRDKYARIVFRQLQSIEREDREFRNKLAAAVRDQLGDLVAAGQSGELKVALPEPVPVPSEIRQEQPAPPSIEGLSVPAAVGDEISASAAFAEPEKGL